MFRVVLLSCLIGMSVGWPGRYRFLDAEAQHACRRCHHAPNRIFLLRPEFFQESVHPYECMLSSRAVSITVTWRGWWACDFHSCTDPIVDFSTDATSLDCKGKTNYCSVFNLSPMFMWYIVTYIYIFLFFYIAFSDEYRSPFCRSPAPENSLFVSESVNFRLRDENIYLTSEESEWYFSHTSDFAAAMMIKIVSQIM
jgi:hypothetical protein